MNPFSSKPWFAVLGIALFVLSSSFLAPLTWAQEKHSINISGEGVKSRYVQQHIIDVDDVPGHQIRVQESQRTYPEDKQFMVDGEHVVVWWIRSFSNYTNGIGPTWGFQTWVTDKGNKIFLESYGTSESQVTETGSKRGIYHGTTRVIGGTGRFAKIRGTLVEVAKFDTDPKAGYSLADTHGQYWFEE